MGTYTKAQLETELTRIKNAVASCRTSIYNQGVLNIPSDVTLAQLPTYVNMIDCSHPDILLDYIQAGDGSNTSQEAQVYFDTGFVPDASTSFEIVCSRPKTGSSNMMFGSYCYNIRLYSSTYLLTYENSWQTINWNIGSTPSTYGNMTYISTSINGSTLSLTIDSSTYTKSITVATKNDTSIYLFARHASDTNIAWTANSGSRIKYVKFYSSHNLVRFYVPVLHYYNGQYTPCFYDKVNDNYIYNLGSGTVTYSSTGDYLLDYLGPDEETAVPVTASSYLRYETGIVADTTIQIDTKFRLLWGGENYIYGSATDSTTTPTWQTFGIGYPGTLTTLRATLGADASASRVVKMTSVGLLAPCTTSHYYENDIGKCYLNKKLFSGSSNIINFSSNTIHIFSRHGNSQNVPVLNGARLYYCLISKSGIVQRSYVPVLHNGSPYLLDLNNGTYNSPVAPAIAVTYSVLE